MEVTDFTKGTAWAILPDHFRQLLSDYRSMMDDPALHKDAKGSGIDGTAKVALPGDAEGSDVKPYKIIDGVAIIPIVGPLSKRMSFMTWLFGGMTFGMISQMFKMALDDPTVNGIVLGVDSPGGVVQGTEGLANLIYNSRGRKPIVAFTDGNMTSAAYWIGSGAESIIANQTSVLGSIGVLMIHRDFSEMEKNRGIKTTFLTAGNYKALGNMSEPLGEKAKEYFQSQLDYVYSIFVDTVALHRDVDTGKVLSEMADGKLFIGQQAKDVGLIDNIGTMGDAIELVLSRTDDSNIYQIAKAKEGSTMDIKTVADLTEAFPSLVAKIQKEAGKVAKATLGDAIDTERGRVCELVKIQFGADAGEPFSQIVKSDITPDLFQATKDLAVPQGKTGDDQDAEFKQKMLDGLASSGADDPGADGSANEPEKDYMTVCREYKAQYKCSLLDAQRAIDLAQPDLRKKYIKAVNS